MEGLLEGECELQILAEKAAQELNSSEDVPMDDAAIEDSEDFRAPEELEDPKRPESSDAPRVPVRGSQFRRE
eukprot:14807244-Alexandrium_andersonii.AAC.1